MRRRALSQEGSGQIGPRIAQQIVRQCGGRTPVPERGLGVHYELSVGFPAESCDRAEAAGLRCTNRIQQLCKEALALPSDGEIHVGSIQRRARVQGREITAPDDGRRRGSRAHRQRGVDRGSHLWAAHDCHADGVESLLVQQALQGSQVVAVDVAVDDPTRAVTLQRSRQRQQGEREARTTPGGDGRIDQQHPRALRGRRRLRHGSPSDPRSTLEARRPIAGE